MKTINSGIADYCIGSCSNLEPNDEGFMEFVKSSRNFELPLQRGLLKAFIAKCGPNSESAGETVLMGCALKGNIFCAKELLSAGADINQLNGEHSALSLAIMSHNNSLFDLLVYCRATLRLKDIKLAFIRNNNHAAEVLLKNCDDIYKWIDVEDVDSLMQYAVEEADNCRDCPARIQSALRNQNLLLRKGFRVTEDNLHWLKTFSIMDEILFIFCFG